MMKRSLSIVVPVYKSGPTLEKLYDRIRNVADGMTDTWELILIDDASNDGTFSFMEKLRAKDQRVRIIRFAKNMGQPHATLCGLQRARNDIIFTLDDDLQNPPEEMPRLLEKLDEGYDLVIGKLEAKKHSSWRNLASWLVHSLASHIAGKPKHISMSAQRCMSKRAAHSIGSYSGANPYLTALIFSSVPVDRITNLDVSHDERLGGKSTYTLAKLVKLTSFLLINHSRLPLRFVAIWGGLLSVFSLCYTALIIVKVLLFGSTAAGWASLAVLVTFLSGNIFLCIGILGEYIGRILQENAHATQFPIFEEQG
jgi:undecaprenyl-phosphate 4-deoxy-4-formamido-L-arabinose transferase